MSFLGFLNMKNVVINEIGITKEFDKLGRLVIPKEIRERYGLTDKVEIIATPDGVLLRSPEYILIKKSEKDG